MSTTKKRKIIDGVLFPIDWPDLVCLFWLFKHSPKLQQRDLVWGIEGKPAIEVPLGSYTGLGRFSYSKSIAQMLFPKLMEWQDWSEKAVQTFCENESTAITGCGGSSKSTSAGLYGWQFYQCDPLNSAVLIVSTTLDSAKKRIWKNINIFYSEFVRMTGDRSSGIVGNPRPSICPLTKQSGEMKRDTAVGLHVIAVAKGELEKGIASMKGFHPRRLLIITDEADSVSQAVVDVRANLRIGTEEFQTIDLGNDPQLFNPLGQQMEPSKGRMVGLENIEWTSTSGIKCLRFDGYDSPNIRDNNKWTGIIRQSDINKITKNGEHAETAMAYIMVRGIHPPEGADETVISQAAIARFNCKDRVTWQHGFIISGMVDPGYGGDPCIYRTFKRGFDTSGLFRVEMDEVIEIPIVVNDPLNPPEYQIAQKSMELSKARTIPPEEFVIGVAGRGAGTASVLQREWSPRIQTCDEGGACSDMIVSEEDPRPAKEIYDRRVTELWFSIREFIEADMLRNLDDATVLQLCQRKHAPKGGGQGKRTSLEKKTDMKDRGVPSPNEADALGFGINMLREKGINASVKSPVKSQANQALQSEEAQHDFTESYEESYI